MKLFNIGILELIFILVIALIFLGPDGIVKTARSLGRTIRKIIRSPIWSMMIDTQRELREVPTKLVREAGLEEDLAEIRKTSQELKKVSGEVGQISPPPTAAGWPPTAYTPPVKTSDSPVENPSEEPVPAEDSLESEQGEQPTDSISPERAESGSEGSD
jgi:sec-independent protein translocase protein TatB